MKTSPDDGLRPRMNLNALLTASAVAAAVFLVLGLVALARPSTRASQTVTPYTQQVTFGYSAQAPAGPVYPTGTIRTGDPIFLSLVHQVVVHVKYRFSTLAEHDIWGSEEIVAQLSGQSGWSRNIVLVPPTRFTGDDTSTDVVLGLRKLESLLAKVGTLTGVPGVTYTVAIEPMIHVTGTVAGNPVNVRFSPAMNFELGPQQLVPQGAATTPSQPGAAAAPPAGGTSTDNLAPAKAKGRNLSHRAGRPDRVRDLGPRLACCAGSRSSACCSRPGRGVLVPPQARRAVPGDAISSLNTGT